MLERKLLQLKENLSEETRILRQMAAQFKQVLNNTDAVCFRLLNGDVVCYVPPYCLKVTRAEEYTQSLKKHTQERGRAEAVKVVKSELMAQMQGDEEAEEAPGKEDALP